MVQVAQWQLIALAVAMLAIGIALGNILFWSYIATQHNNVYPSSGLLSICSHARSSRLITISYHYAYLE